jgi:hypothetical protein
MIPRVCGVVLLCAALWTQGKQSTPAADPDKLDSLAPLIGRDWTAPLPNGNLTDTQRFEWMYGKKFVRNTHFVKTTKGEVVYEGETVYAWTPALVVSCGGIGTPPAAIWKGPPPLALTARSQRKAKTTATQANSTAPGLPSGSPLMGGPLPHPMRKTVSGTTSLRAPTARSGGMFPHRRRRLPAGCVLTRHSRVCTEPPNGAE